MFFGHNVIYVKKRKWYVLLPNITVFTAVPCALPYQVTQSSVYHVVPLVSSRLRA